MTTSSQQESSALSTIDSPSTQTQHPRKPQAKVAKQRPPMNSHSPVEDEGIIRCICGYDEDDGFTIQCEKCLVWQHAACLRIQKNNVPDVYFCEQCRPRELDVDYAKEVQRKRRIPKQSQRKKTNNPSGPQATASAASAKSTFPPNASSALSSSLNAEPSGFKSPNKSHSTSLHPDQSGHAASDTRSLLSDDEEDQDDLLVDVMEDYIPIQRNLVDKQVVPVFSRLLHLLDAGKEEDSALPLDHHLCHILQHATLVSSSSDFFNSVHHNHCTLQSIHPKQSHCVGVIIQEPKEPQQLLMEMRTEFLLVRSDGQELASLISPMAQSSSFYVHPFPFYQLNDHESSNEHSEEMVVADCRRYGNEARFIRYSCRPNAELKPVLIQEEQKSSEKSADYSKDVIRDRVRLAVYSACSLVPNDEVTLPFPFLSIQEEISEEYVNRNKELVDLWQLASVICACSDSDSCHFSRVYRNLSGSSMSNRSSISHSTTKREEEIIDVEHMEMDIVSHPSMTSSKAPSPRKEKRPKQPSNLSTQSLPLNSDDPDSIFSKPDHMLTREERKLRDEMRRFAKMEEKMAQAHQNAQQKRKRSVQPAVPGSKPMPSPRDKQSEKSDRRFNDQSDTDSIASNRRKKVRTMTSTLPVSVDRNHSDDENQLFSADNNTTADQSLVTSAASSRPHSPISVDSSTHSQYTPLKKRWMRKFLVTQDTISEVTSVENGSDTKTVTNTEADPDSTRNSSVTSPVLKNDHEKQEETHGSNSSLAVIPEPLDDTVEERKDENAHSAVEEAKSQLAAMMEVDSPVKTTAPEVKTEVNVLASLSQNVEPLSISSSSASSTEHLVAHVDKQSEPEQSAPPARISLKDYKKRKSVQEANKNENSLVVSSAPVSAAISEDPDEEQQANGIKSALA